MPSGPHQLGWGSRNLSKKMTPAQVCTIFCKENVGGGQVDQSHAYCLKSVMTIELLVGSSSCCGAACSGASCLRK